MSFNQFVATRICVSDVHWQIRFKLVQRSQVCQLHQRIQHGALRQQVCTCRCIIVLQSLHILLATHGTYEISQTFVADYSHSELFDSNGVLPPAQHCTAMKPQPRATTHLPKPKRLREARP